MRAFIFGIVVTLPVLLVVFVLLPLLISLLSRDDSDNAQRDSAVDQFIKTTVYTVLGIVALMMGMLLTPFALLFDLVFFLQKASPRVALRLWHYVLSDLINNHSWHYIDQVDNTIKLYAALLLGALVILAGLIF